MMMMMMMMMMIMMDDDELFLWYGWQEFSLISSQDYCQRSSPSWISGMSPGGFEPAQYLSSGLVEWSCAAVKTTTFLRHWCTIIETSFMNILGAIWTWFNKVIYQQCKKTTKYNLILQSAVLKWNWYNLFWKIFLIPFSKQNMRLQALLCSLCQCKVHLLLHVPRNPIKSARKLFWKTVSHKSFFSFNI